MVKKKFIDPTFKPEGSNGSEKNQNQKESEEKKAMNKTTVNLKNLNKKQLEMTISGKDKLEDGLNIDDKASHAA